VVSGLNRWKTQQQSAQSPPYHPTQSGTRPPHPNTTPPRPHTHLHSQLHRDRPGPVQLRSQVSLGALRSEADLQTLFGLVSVFWWWVGLGWIGVCEPLAKKPGKRPISNPPLPAPSTKQPENPPQPRQPALRDAVRHVAHAKRLVDGGGVAGAIGSSLSTSTQ